MNALEVIDYIVNWLERYCEKAGMNGFAVGVSGGIDSAVTSTLCAKTGKTVVPLNLPIHQASDQESLSAAHIKMLEEKFDNVKGARVDLTPVFSAFKEALPEKIGEDGMAMANSRSRIRMVTLYAFAASKKLLVAGTGNKVEDFGVGFYTKYGDGGVDISPIADLTKSEVYAIARELGVMEAIQQAPPTDGLWSDNRTDESQIGASYDELEWAMEADASPSFDENTLGERKKKVLSIYRGFQRANQHKMQAIPVCRIPESLK